MNKKLPDGTLISVGGTSYDDFYINLLAALGDKDAAEDVMYELRAAFVPTAAGPGLATAEANVTRAFPGVERAESADTPPVCSHGMARVYKNGTSQASGKPWKAWMCVLPKGQSCEPVWIR